MQGIPSSVTPLVEASNSPLPPNGSTPYLSLVIPAYNEEQRLPGTLSAVADFVSKREYAMEVIVVDDGSRDSTIAVVRDARPQFGDNAALRLLRHKVNRGKGAAVRTGCLAATGQFVFYMDADLSTPVQEVDKLLDRLQSGFDVAVGTRIQPDGSDARASQPWWRRLMGKLFTSVRKRLVVEEIDDTQCPLKGFTRDAVNQIFPLQRADGWVFDAEILFLASRRRLRIAEVPVEWEHRPGSKARPSIVQALSVAWELSRIRFRRL
jgi:dolichyl-phosphate beta-glucosyltransferase